MEFFFSAPIPLLIIFWLLVMTGLRLFWILIYYIFMYLLFLSTFTQAGFGYMHYCLLFNLIIKLINKLFCGYSQSQ